MFFCANTCQFPQNLPAEDCTQASLVKGRWPSVSEVGGIRSTVYGFAETLGEKAAPYRESPADKLPEQSICCPL